MCGFKAQLVEHRTGIAEVTGSNHSRAQNIFMPKNINSIVISPYLFVTAVQILARAIRSDSDLRGIKAGEDETKVLAYADDMTATLSDTSSVERLLTTVFECLQETFWAKNEFKEN